MQRAWLLPVTVAVVTAGVIVATRHPPANGEAIVPSAPAPGVGTEPLVALDAYVDPDFGFTLAVPAGWTPIVMAESDAELASLEPGYAIGFESPREHAGDVYSDYLMIEILPGDEAGLFETDGRRRRATVVDGRPAWRDALTLPADAGDAASVDLIVRQAATSGLGYTVGLYAVGQPARRALIDDAFEVMLRTFHLPRRPFDVS